MNTPNKPFSLDDILDEAYGVPVSFGEYNRFAEKVKETIRKADRDGDLVPDEKSFKYPGHMRYIIHAGGITFEIIARKRNNSTYEISEVNTHER